ncbi:MAG: hypothetical protein MHMPM18_003092 [Marteilia pararefringens]
MNPNSSQQYAMNSNSSQQYAMNPNSSQQFAMNPNSSQQYAMSPNSYQQYAVSPNSSQQFAMSPNSYQQYAMNPNAFQQQQNMFTKPQSNVRKGMDLSKERDDSNLQYVLAKVRGKKQKYMLLELRDKEYKRNENNGFGEDLK